MPMQKASGAIANMEIGTLTSSGSRREVPEKVAEQKQMRRGQNGDTGDGDPRRPAIAAHTQSECARGSAAQAGEHQEGAEYG